MTYQRELFPKQESRIGDVEREALLRGYQYIVGVDEAGRGPLAGPVYASAVILDLESFAVEVDRHRDDVWYADLNDSKKLKEATRACLFDVIKEQALAWSIVAKEREVIDEINILEATRLAMKESIEDVCRALCVPIDRVFIDGNQYVDVEQHQTAVIKGDGRSYHIAAASVLAKVGRDRLMVEHDKVWPEYGFAKHKGYGTKAHREAIATHGPCTLHRLSFGGVREHRARLRLAP